MPRWPLVAALLLAPAGGPALVTPQLMQGEAASQGDAGSDEAIAASPEAIAAPAAIAADPHAAKPAPAGPDVTTLRYSDSTCAFFRKITTEHQRRANGGGT